MIPIVKSEFVFTFDGYNQFIFINHYILHLIRKKFEYVFNL
jgi:hypothetical protein